MKKLLSALLILSIFSAINVRGAGHAVLQGVTFTVDTVYHQKIGSGVTQSKIVFKNGSRTINTFVVDMRKDEGNGMRIKVDVGKDSCNTAEAITSIAKRKGTETNHYLAGINGDFFITSSFAQQHEFGNAILGYPNMACATEGNIVAPDMIDITSRENAFIVGEDGQMWIDATDFTYTLSDPVSSSSVKATAINYPRRDDELMLYNRYIGNYTKTSAQGREIILRPVSGNALKINRNETFVVVGDWHPGQTKIEGDDIVISCGPKFSNNFIDGLKAGDKVLVNIELSLPAFGGIKPQVSEICGGDVRILKENVTTTEAIRWINTPSAQYSRSLVGYSEDRNQIVLCAIDAGGGSSGATYYESADIMRALGCYDALDLDGGGSTAIWTHSHGILNNLRDGSERAVGNGIFFVLDATDDTEVSDIEFADYNLTLPAYALYTPTVYGYNRHGQLVDTNFDSFELDSTSGLGEIQPDGKSILLTGTGVHTLTARNGSMSASIKITVDAEATAVPVLSSYLLDGYHPRTISLAAQVGDRTMSVSPLAYEWKVEDEDIISVDANGEMRGLTNGTTIVSGTLNGQTVTIPVTVEKPASSDIPLFSEWNPDNWTIKRSNVSSAVSVANNSGDGFDITYKISSARAPSIKLSCEEKFYSCPDGISVTFGQDKDAIAGVMIALKAANSNREISLTASKDQLPQAGETKSVDFDLKSVLDIEDPGIYPLSFQGITFTVPSKTEEYTLNFHGINGLYSYAEDGVEDITVPACDYGKLTYRLDGNIVFLPFIAEKIEIFSLAGHKLNTISNSDSIKLPGAGIYIIRCIYKSKTLVGRLFFH